MQTEPRSPYQLSHLLQLWRKEPTVAANVVNWRKEPAQPASVVDFPGEVHPTLKTYLEQKGISRLYSHQAESWQYICQGKNVVVVTSTASGKTLCYNLPVLDRILREPQARALYLFPTKALTQDQYQGLSAVNAWLTQQGYDPAPAAVYDGDTPTGQRPAIRTKARILLSNPDMLHTGILPHHTRWAEFFRDLRYVVIDEIHTYRGVFGSHVANLLRRLQRVARFYGATPQFILTSATIANPDQLAEHLIEQPVQIVDQDGSPRGERNFLLYNPPIINAELGLRASASSESVRLTGDLLAEDIQSLLFCRARRSVEILLKHLQNTTGSAADSLRSYRSGYLPRERREIERSLREGQARAVVATNALELGIDIGGVDAVVLVGYPGTIASHSPAGRPCRSPARRLTCGSGGLRQSTRPVLNAAPRIYF
jgi:DEAD/DEAH box helicase domain-containing protein